MFHDLELPIAADAAAAAVALFSAARLRALNRVVGEPRLARLQGLFSLLAAALLLRVVGALAFEISGTGAIREGFGGLDALFWLTHAATVAAIIAGGLAIGGPHPQRDAAADRMYVMAPLLVGAAPALLLLEGLGFAYLTLRSGLNHIRRTNVGSLQVTLGFFLLTAAWLLPIILFPEGVHPLGPPHWVTALVGLAGVVVLASAIPSGGRRRA